MNQDLTDNELQIIRTIVDLSKKDNKSVYETLDFLDDVLIKMTIHQLFVIESEGKNEK